MALAGISLFSLIAASSGVWSLNEVAKSLKHVTDERVPQALTWTEVARQTERIVSAAPALLVVDSEDARAEVSASIRNEADKLKDLIAEIGRGDETIEAPAVSATDLVLDLDKNLDDLDRLVQQRLAVTAQRIKLSRRVTQTSSTSLRLVQPASRIMGVQVSEWHETGAAEAGNLSERQTEIAQSVIGLLPQIDVVTKIDKASADLQKVASAGTAEEIDVLNFSLERSIQELEETATAVPARSLRRLNRQIDVFKALASGSESIGVVRKQELALILEAENLLIENGRLSKLLGTRINLLVNDAKADITVAKQQAEAVSDVNTKVLIAVGALSVISSVLIVWLYVGRTIIRRLRALSDSMLAIAGGDLRASLPRPGTNDEIGRMGEALIVFRDTAVEVEKSNLREIETTRRRLVDAIENSSEGFAFYDPAGKLVICNSRYRNLIFPNMDQAIEPGMEFESILQRAAENGHFIQSGQSNEDWIAEQIASHQNPGEPRLQKSGDETWLLISERKTSDGGTVAIYSDITVLKAREAELSEKSNALEQLSNQLAKYLSPQIYNSIFSGKQEVRLASQRKRLTVFFSDLVGFTETTERLESEDLTRLLNQYLTEMSEIAIAHGATIDKYIGDAIVIFFGDPETLGVEEDAIQCVKMAIAMRKRMTELEQIWKDSGLENPLRCRMGISTGVCTVGNFGSDERMDYTIIGGGVNLAARLESACEPGEILISFETYAHVKDLIECEERDQIQVKGIAGPVTTYQVNDLFENLNATIRPIRANLPNFNLEINIGQMTQEEQTSILAVLKEASEAISANHKTQTKPS